MKKELQLFLFAFIFLGNCVSAQNAKELETIIDKVSPDAIKGNMSFLADDLLEGRQPGTRGFLLASKFVETQFMAMGLKTGNKQNRLHPESTIRKRLGR